MQVVSIETAARESKYCDGIRQTVKKLGHATNAMIAAELRKTFPSLSATTVHRATARLAARGELMSAPADNSGAMRYELHKKPHDHFMCTVCGQLRDVDIAPEVTALLRSKRVECYPSGQVVVSGVCGRCH